MAEPALGRARERPSRAHSNGPASWERSLRRGHLSPLFERLASWGNLLLAHRRASRGKRGHASVAAFDHNLEAELADLRHRLLAGTYEPGRYSSFFIHEPKRRLISAAPFRDRVVHHALVNVIEPIFEAGFISHTYANRKGKGTHRALDHAQRLARRHGFVLQLDVRQFFPSIDHAILRELLARKVTDPGVLWLVDQLLASGREVLSAQYDMIYFPGDDLFAVTRPRGLPIGNLTSQFWGNLYLSRLDHFVQRELRPRGYVRYVDDLLLFADEKQYLWHCKDELVARLAELRLTVHAGGHPRPTSEGVPFLGFVVFPERRRLKRRKVIACRRRLKAAVAGWLAGDLALESVVASARGWLNHARFGNTAGLQKTVLGSLPPEVGRAIEGGRA